ncbi:hypothetical protein [Bradyrhizobium sp. ISRA463]|uniref:hypothetical protein n=1 Tax=Bradyrhizobium sp. ISRA463 TaxID=2866199 RepID=UPI0024793797|nr:hypothetical protein [Bradyrhizobium sp. ISRA463]WGS19258.1 hypothetical protein MTX22_33295 [Bradyrhizobium sp. ISRA463]
MCDELVRGHDNPQTQVASLVWLFTNEALRWLESCYFARGITLSAPTDAISCFAVTGASTGACPRAQGRRQVAGTPSLCDQREGRRLPRSAPDLSPSHDRAQVRDETDSDIEAIKIAHDAGGEATGHNLISHYATPRASDAGWYCLFKARANCVGLIWEGNLPRGRVVGPTCRNVDSRLQTYPMKVYLFIGVSAPQVRRPTPIHVDALLMVDLGCSVDLAAAREVEAGRPRRSLEQLLPPAVF